MLCQSDNADGTSLRRLLLAGGFVCRLSSQLLHYSREPPPVSIPIVLRPPAASVHALDGALPVGMLTMLQRALSSTSPFWSEHGYACVGKPSPFFSFVHELPHPVAKGRAARPPTGLDRVFEKLRDLAVARFPKAAAARYVEWWAHCRPHGVGHQLHYDSDDEGRGGVRNPLVSSALYLTGAVGGPTVVTEQRMGSGLAEKAWSVLPAVNRYLLFDGRLLHGVVPGRGGIDADAGARRTTLMVAFWDKIEPRREGTGAAQLFPYDALGPSSGPGEPRWPRLFDWPANLDPSIWPVNFTGGATKHPAEVPLRPIAPVWEAASEDASDLFESEETMPSYEQCFQGLC